MIGYLLFFQLLATVAVKARPHYDDDIFEEIQQNDANLNPGFDIDAFRQDQLDYHNYYRQFHGVPSMTLDSELTSAAQTYAEKLAANNNGLNHCELPDCDRGGAGENLASAWGSTSAETNATKNWYDEIWDYNFCTGGNRPGHEGKAIGHFTQVVWKTSTKLGIGYARISDRTKVYVVARYLDHGNVGGQYTANVLKPDYIFQTFDDNCNGVNGGLSAWSSPGECTRSCGGGVKLKTRTCTNPKPSLNGRDCDGDTKEIAVQEWCNVESCSGDKKHRDLQCEARGHTAKSHNFGGASDCKLHCLQSGSTYTAAGNVDDGTHCNSDSGACVAGECKDMPDYVAPVVTGEITGSYTKTPSSNVWDNEILAIPNRATDVIVTNNKYNDVRLFAGYKSSGGVGYNFAEASWMNSWVDYQGHYTTTHTTKGVTYEYKRVESRSTFKITGPVQATSGYTFVFYVNGTNPADITWSYNV